MNYHIISIERSRNVPTWWNAKGSGYTTNLAEAGVYADWEIRFDPERYNNGFTTAAIAVEDAAVMTLDQLLEFAATVQMPNTAPKTKGGTKLYCFINGGAGTTWQEVVALDENGKCAAGHVSSSLGFAKHDIGVTSDWKHDKYRELYPQGYELEWVDDPLHHPGCAKALELANA